MAGEGEKDLDVWKSKNYTYKMLLIGETGSGRTSFLNLICNCGMIQALGCKFDGEGLSRFEQFNDIKMENANSLSMESKTTGAKLYEAELGELKVGIIDTPGFGDTRGIDQDKKNAKAIIDALKDEEYIDCVCLVINGRQSRMSANLRYVLTEITSILPREVLSNIIVVFTNTADPLDLNFDITGLNDFFGTLIDRHFFVENPYCRFEMANLKQGQLPQGQVARNLKKYFEETAKVLIEMSTAVNTFEIVQAHKFTILYERKQNIELLLDILATIQYNNLERMQKSIKEAQEKVEAALVTKTLCNEFRFKQKIKKMTTVRTANHNLVCGFPDCYSNCSINCHLPKLFDKERFKHCNAFGGKDYCRMCGHHYSYHYHNEVRFEEEVYEKEYIDEDMQHRFKEAETMEQKASILKKELEEEFGEMEKKKKILSEQLLAKISEFQELGINRNYTKLIECQLEVIEVRLQGTTGSEAKQLRKTKQELEKRLEIVLEAVKK